MTLLLAGLTLGPVPALAGEYHALTPVGGHEATGPDIRVNASSVDPATLPQTHDLPQAKGPAFEAAVQALWSAIVQDRPEQAMPFFFPLPAYQQVKAIRNPPEDWQHRLVAAYTRDIHALHLRLGPHADRATLIGLEVPSRQARWIDPGAEYNKLGYYRVYGSRLRYVLEGKPDAMAVRSLISWRGTWYVVHLAALK